MSARFRKRGGGRSGKIAVGSIAATVAGAVIKDLSRPNSLIRGLVAAARAKLLAKRETQPAIDISDTVTVEKVENQQANGTVSNSKDKDRR